MGLFQSISYYLRIDSNNFICNTYHDADIKEREKKEKRKSNKKEKRKIICVIFNSKISIYLQLIYEKIA